MKSSIVQESHHHPTKTSKYCDIPYSSDRYGGEASVPITTSVGTRTTAIPNQKFKDKAAQEFIEKILAALVELATCRTQTEVYSKQAGIKELVASAKGLGVSSVVKAGVVAGIANQSSPKQKEDMGYYFGKLSAIR